VSVIRRRSGVAFVTRRLFSATASPFGWSVVLPDLRVFRRPFQVPADAGIFAPPGFVKYPFSVIVAQVRSPEAFRRTLLVSQQGPNVAAPPQIRTGVVVSQELPGQPLPKFLTTISGIVSVLPERRSVITTQEQFFGLRTDRYQGPNVQGPNVAAPPQIRTGVVVSQELPGHSLPQYAFGVRGPNVATAPQIRSYVTVSQELPDHPSPQNFLARSGLDVATPGRRAGAVFQEQPSPLPEPRSRLGVPPIPLNAPASGLVVRQELPGYPLPQYWLGVRGPNVAALPQIRSYATVSQELPGHPSPQVNPTTAPVPTIIPSGRRGVITLQEWPYHPDPKFKISFQNQTIRGAVLDRTLVVQELPSHPLPLTRYVPPLSFIQFACVAAPVTVPYSAATVSASALGAVIGADVARYLAGQFDVAYHQIVSLTQAQVFRFTGQDAAPYAQMSSDVARWTMGMSELACRD
jgi:hypothetical protein